jgi:prolyl-tRNA synthetase
MSTLYIPTLKEDPVDAEIASHRMLLRAGLLRRVSPGIYAFLPLGHRVLRKIEQVVREEMNAIGSQEILMPILQPAELWEQSGRWEVYGPELMRLVDRHERCFALGPTHEELVTALTRNELRSYRELPLSLFHIQWKYRDEIRPRFGLLRGREFLMKDAYSFHASQESLQAHYDEQARAYGRICDRLGLEWRVVEADSGQIGGEVSAEFMALAEAGEAGILYCGCGFAANVEVAAARVAPLAHEAPSFEKVATPGVSTIGALAEFLDIPQAATVKALAARDGAGRVTVLFIPGDHELSMVKAEKSCEGLELLTDEEMQAAGLVKGFIGPCGLPEGVRVVADASLEGVAQWVVGANETDCHYVGARTGEDFTVPEWADLCEAQPGDGCPVCGSPLKAARGIEVGQVFQLGTKYSASMQATYMDEDNNEHPFMMGCYGWGVTRSLAAVVEQHNDEAGIVWPVSVCPAEVAVIPLTVGDEAVWPVARGLADELALAGVEVVFDDRAERAGVKFNDADLIGFPYQLVVGKRGLEAGVVELKDRANGERSDLAVSEAVAFIVATVAAERARYL